MTVLFFGIYIFYKQIDISVVSIKKSIFFAVQNSYLGFDKDKLSMYEYKIDLDEAKNKVYNIINLNYKDKVKINEYRYDYEKNSVHIEYSIRFVPVLFKTLYKNGEWVNFSEDIKLKMMEVK